jgi:hypothetical protein
MRSVWNYEENMKQLRGYYGEALRAKLKVDEGNI